MEASVLLTLSSVTWMTNHTGTNLNQRFKGLMYPALVK